MHNGELTAEQKARITQNFRAAKARLARKRPLNDAALSDHSFPHKILDANGFITPIKRVPLAEISINTTTPFTENKFSSSTYRDKFSGNSCSENGVVWGSSFSTLKKQPEPSTLSHTSSSSSSSLLSFPSRLDDDFNDSILAEIDALVEQASAAKAEKTSLNSEPLALLQNSGSSCGDSNISFESLKADEVIKSEGIFELGIDVECKEEELDYSTSAPKIVNMPEEFSKYLQSLNDRQREAACSEISIPLMIVAGPGSGKTSTMVGRILMLMNEGISPSNILAMTFTTAAASEMRDRIGKVTGKARAKDLTISTFHSFSLQLCRSHAEKIGRTSDFIIYGHGQQRRAITEAVRLLQNENSKKHLDNPVAGEESNGISLQYCKDMSKKWQKLVTQAKAYGKTPADYCKLGDELGATILGNYNNILKSCNALDYHDMINCSMKLLTDFPEVLKECQELWRAIVIDEFQDTSAMQYRLLKMLASHNHITIVGDDDQSIFSFNGADISGFHSFRKDFPNFKEVRLNKNYRSTRHIVEAASSVIRNNTKRCHLKSVDTDNFSGSKILVKECHNEDAQCSFIVDKIFEMTSVSSDGKSSFGDFAILYRRQVSGKVFQTAFRERKIPFNIHGVAFYRKKVVRAITAMLSTVLRDCDDGSYRRVFKALLPFEKEEKKRVIEHIEKISIVRKCSFISAARDIFNAKVSGTFKRSQLTQGRKVLLTLEMVSKLIQREGSITAVITSVANMVPQGYLLEQRAIIDVDGGKLLNEDNDMRPVLQYLLDDVSDFLSTKFVAEKEEGEMVKEKGCLNIIKAFIDHLSERERENFRSRKQDNVNSVTLTTIHQSKGLEWDNVFIIKANEFEIPLLHEISGVTMENAASVEEERRLFYVAMTRARTKLFVLYVTTDSNFQILRPSRFLKEIPDHLREVQAELSIQDLQARPNDCQKGTANLTINLPQKVHGSEADMVTSDSTLDKMNEDLESMEPVEASNGNYFLKRFSVEERSIVSHLFHQWAKKPAFQDPKRLVNKVGFVIDERLRVKNKHKDVLRSLKSYLQCDEAFLYAEYVLRWEKIPADQRAQLVREKQEHFQKLRIESSMGSSAPTSKQISYLQKLGCTVAPTSRLHASRLIEQYKSL